MTEKILKMLEIAIKHVKLKRQGIMIGTVPETMPEYKEMMDTFTNMPLVERQELAIICEAADTLSQHLLRLGIFKVSGRPSNN